MSPGGRVTKNRTQLAWVLLGYCPNTAPEERGVRMNDTNTVAAPTFISLDEAAALGEGTRITFVPGVQAL